MRLQLILALALASAPAAADPGAEATLRVYTDDDDMTVISPSVSAGAALGETEVDVDATADVVTGASVDVVTSASPRPIDERRLELGVGGVRPLTDLWTATASLRGSHENDHDAVRAAAGVRVDRMQRRLTLDARYTAGYDAVGTVDDPSFAAGRTLHQADLGLTVVTDPRTLVDVLVEATTIAGYQANPYRRVPLVDPDLPMPTWLAEDVPAHRRALAVSARVRRAFGTTWFAALGYRVYADTWAIESHTATVEARRVLGERVLAGASVRGYLQDGASFYRAIYEGAAPELRTRDRTLGPMRTLFTALTADVALDEDGRWHVLAAAGVLASWFPEFPLQTERDALVLTLSVSTSLEGGTP